jgi:acetolactate synthase-1/2/3 large subunit
VPIVGDAKVVLASLNERLHKEGAKPVDDGWFAEVCSWRERWPFYTDDFASTVDYPDKIAPEVVLSMLSDKLDPDASIVTTEVGQHQMWAHQNIRREHARTFLSSGGAGTMGFGFPAAIGAKIGCPDDEVVCIAGDGSFQMNVQEMATAIQEGVPVKVLIIDNRALGMVYQWQKLFYHERYSFTKLPPVPDFVKLADAYGWRGKRISRPEEVEDALDEMLASKEPYLLDVVIPTDQTVYPMVAPGAPIDDIIGALDVTLGGVRVSGKGFGKDGRPATAGGEKDGDE